MNTEKFFPGLYVLTEDVTRPSTVGEKVDKRLRTDNWLNQSEYKKGTVFVVEDIVIGGPKDKMLMIAATYDRRNRSGSHGSYYIWLESLMNENPQKLVRKPIKSAQDFIDANGINELTIVGIIDTLLRNDIIDISLLDEGLKMYKDEE